MHVLLKYFNENITIDLHQCEKNAVKQWRSQNKNDFKSTYSVIRTTFSTIVILSFTLKADKTSTFVANK